MLTIAEFARATNRSPDVLRRWLRSGRLPGEKSASGEWLIPPDALRELDAIPRSHRRPPRLAA